MSSIIQTNWDDAIYKSNSVCYEPLKWELNKKHETPEIDGATFSQNSSSISINVIVNIVPWYILLLTAVIPQKGSNDVFVHAN